MGTEINRNLATIQKISSVTKHPNADTLDIVQVLGWQVITKLGEFKAGNLCVMIEVDSFLPVRPEFEFLRKSGFRSTKNLGDGFRLRSIKLRKELSQGLVMPIATLFPTSSEAFEIGQDVTDQLKIKKYELPIPSHLAGKAKGLFPSFLKKTDQERVQNIWNKLKPDHDEDEYEVTVKLDGSSMTMYYKYQKYNFWDKLLAKLYLKKLKESFGVCSRNLDLKLVGNEDNTFVKVALKYRGKIERYCEMNKCNLAFQGELLGPGIQKNPDNLSDHEFYLFDIYDIDEREYLSPSARHYKNTSIRLPHVPVLGYKHLRDFKDLDEILTYANQKSLSGKLAEGVVFKNMHSQDSFKVLCNEYLLTEIE